MLLVIYLTCELLFRENVSICRSFATNNSVIYFYLLLSGKTQKSINILPEAQ